MTYSNHSDVASGLAKVNYQLTIALFPYFVATSFDLTDS